MDGGVVWLLLCLMRLVWFEMVCVTIWIVPLSDS